ncbi:hypothetical protein K501DRAFT_278484 [Backusella circina FSU 941]|nr:hypothetical protein K501DRAFT_278484 [Backusella circina FSU 941]
MISKAYYKQGDNQMKKYKLNLAAYKMKQNKFHKYAVNIAAGNWKKLVGCVNVTMNWFEKAVEYDPLCYYGCTLLVFEELERENYIAALMYFEKFIVANRCFITWNDTNV